MFTTLEAIQTYERRMIVKYCIYCSPSGNSLYRMVLVPDLPS